MSLVEEGSVSDRVTAHHSSGYLVPPVLLFSMLLIPIVINCFFMVYSLVGWILEGRDKFNWSLEAVDVALWVAATMFLWCAFQLAYAHWKQLPSGHILRISSYGHALIAVLMTLSVFITVRL